MPAQGTEIRALTDIHGNYNSLAMKRVVVPAIVEFFLDTSANLEREVWRDGYIA